MYNARLAGVFSLFSYFFPLNENSTRISRRRAERILCAASVTHLKPKAIYIGVKTAKEQAEKIYMICKQQNIPCYKMLQSYVTSDFSLDHIPYEEFAATHYTQNK